MATTKIKSRLTEDEKKKVDALSKLEDAYKKSSGTQIKKREEEDKKSQAPVKYTQGEEAKSASSYSDAIKSSGEEYFAPLLEEEKKEIDERLKGANLSRPIDDGSGISDRLSTMPYIKDLSGGEEENASPRTLNELFSSLDDINKRHEGKTDRDYYEKFLPEVKESLGLEKLEAVEVDENKIKADVEKSLMGEYEKKKDNAVSTSAREIESEKEFQNNLIKSAEENKEEISAIYDEAKIEASNQSLKRGLARSSIALLSINGLEEGKAKELASLAENLSGALDESERLVQSLRDELESSLESLDIEYAIEVNEKIKEEVEKLYKKQKEVIEFNNNVEKLETDYQSKRNSLLKDREELAEKYSEEYKGIATKTRENEIEEAVLNYLKNMSKSEAIKVLATDSRFTQYLGSKFYDVYYRIMRGLE